MDLDSLKILLNELKEKNNNIKETLKIDEKKETLKSLEKQTMQEGFWENVSLQSKVLSDIKNIKNVIEKINKLEAEIFELEGHYEIALELNDLDSYNEALKILKGLSEELNRLEMDTLLNEEYDTNNAILTIHPGAGGTESQDWAEMLYRMYTRWSLKNKFNIEVLDFQAGDEAGIKSVSFIVKGENAYGYLKGESGVHRLVRISPFDSNSRRHTSFAAVEVLPEITESVDVVINPEDIEMDVYRASGAGGQHVNKTSSAVRLRHIPSGIVVTCQTERSQLQNRENAMKMLISKLHKINIQKQKDKINNIKGEVSDNSWGNQIRSYVFCPYTLVKDHRTNYEVGNVQAVMDGKIDDFIFEYLKFKKEKS